MFSPNELNSQYGRECRERQQFWDAIGVYKKQRSKFAAWLGHSSAIELWRENKDYDPNLLIECYAEYKEEKGWVVQGKFVNSTIKGYHHYDSITLDELHNKEEENMDNTFEQRRYMETRLHSVYLDHDHALRSHFHMDPDYPATLREGLDRIAKGTVKFPTAEKLEDIGYLMDGTFFADAIWGSVDWRTTDADKDGFKAAEKLLNKAFTDAKDTIKVADPKDGLTALKEFESKTFY